MSVPSYTQYANLKKQLDAFSGRLMSLTREEEVTHQRIVYEMKSLRVDWLKFKSDVAHRWALAIHLALEDHEGSYQTVERVLSGEINAQPNGCYMKSFDEACRFAIDVVELPMAMWYPLMLHTDPTYGWANDSVAWADSVLSGTPDKDYPFAEPEPV